MTLAARKRRKLLKESQKLFEDVKLRDSQNGSERGAKGETGWPERV